MTMPVGAWLREQGRRNLFSVHLSCSPRERFVRFVYREASREASLRVSALIPLGWNIDPGEARRALRQLEGVDAERLESRMLEADSRDEEDRARLHDVYGFDYGAAVPSDAALDTSSLSTRETAEAIWKLLQGTIQ